MNITRILNYTIIDFSGVINPAAQGLNGTITQLTTREKARL